MPVRIERLEPRPGKQDHAYLGRYGYIVADPTVTSKQRKLKAHQKIVSTLDEAAHWVEVERWHIRMGDDWRTASLIEPDMVRVIRAP